MYRSKSVGVALASVLLGGAVLAVSGYALASHTAHDAPLTCVPIVSQPHECTITFSAYPDSLSGMHGSNGGAHPDWVSYSTDNIVLPANTLVHMKIQNYDGGGAPNNDYFRRVVGTIGGTAKFDGKTLSYWNQDMGHTFTMRGIPGNQPPLFISVPLPANPDVDTCGEATKPLPICATQGSGNYPKNPSVVEFSFRTKGKGVYQWNCEFPCGGSRQGQFGMAMSTWSYMSGTVTVR